MTQPPPGTDPPEQPPPAPWGQPGQQQWPQPQTQPQTQHHGAVTPARGVQAGSLIGGLVIGLLLGAIYVVFAFFVGSSLSGGIDGTGAAGTALFLLPYGVPFVLAAILLSFPRTRMAGAGMLMGVALGAIVMPGVCVVMLGGMGAGF